MGEKKSQFMVKMGAVDFKERVVRFGNMRNCSARDERGELNGYKIQEKQAIYRQKLLE